MSGTQTQRTYRLCVDARTSASNVWKGDASAIQGFFQHPAAFSRVCTFIHEITGEVIRGVPPSDWQLEVMHAWEVYRLLINDKPRQARSSEAFLRVTLKHAEYRMGCRAVLVVNKDSVAENLFQRLNDNYENQPNEVRVPLRSGETRGSKLSIDFIHGGGINVVSAQERAPSVGGSPRVFWFSEFGKITPSERQDETVKNLLPGGLKKPDLMVGFESTPGRAGDGYHSRWLQAFSGESNYVALFLCWLKSQEYTVAVEPGWQPNDVERELMEVYGATLGHARFIHNVWLEFNRDWSSVWNMYPRDAMDGWEVTSGSTGIPSSVLSESLEKATDDASLPDIERISGFKEVRKPFAKTSGKDGEKVLLVVDPAGWAHSGDPTGMMAFSERGDNIATFMARINPIVAADIIEEVCSYYYGLTGEAVVLAIESNKSDVITALTDRQSNRRGPATFEFYIDRNFNDGVSSVGWFSTDKKKRRAETRLVANVKRRQMLLRTRAVLAQLGSYDRSKAWTRSGSGKDKHHYELAICALMGADVMVNMGWLGEAEVAPKNPALAAPIMTPDQAFVAKLLRDAKQAKPMRRGFFANSKAAQR